MSDSTNYKSAQCQLATTTDSKRWTAALTNLPKKLVAQPVHWHSACVHPCLFKLSRLNINVRREPILLLLRFPLFLSLFLCACALSFTHCAVFLLPFFFIHCNNSSVCLCTTCARRICSLLLVRYPHLGNTIAIGRCRTASQGHCHSGWGKAIVRSKLILDRLRPCLFLRDRHRSLLRHTFDHHRNDPQHPTQVHNHRNANI